MARRCVQHGDVGTLKKKMQLTELCKLSLDMYRGLWGPLQSHTRNPKRDPIRLSALASFQLTLRMLVKVISKVKGQQKPGP